MNWEGAKCEGLTLDWFFSKIRRETQETLIAKAICANCPIQTRCAQYSIEKVDTQLYKSTREELGIYGGMTTRIRHEYKKLDTKQRKAFLTKHNKEVLQRLEKSSKRICAGLPAMKELIRSLLEKA